MMKYLFLFCLLLFAYWLPAQEVRYSFDKKNILLGEQVTMKIQALISAGEVNDVFSPDTLPHFEVLDQSKIDTVNVSGQLGLTQTVIITSWDSGSWQLPTLIKNGNAGQPVTIEVGYTSPWDPKQPYNDIKGIVPVEKPHQSTWWWYVIGLAVLVALFLLFFPEGKAEKKSELDSNAYKKAMQQLQKLQSDKEAPANVKQYYTELINIFRTYLKGAKGITSFSKTTGDLSIQLQQFKMPSAEYNELVQTLRLSDLVKFAQYKPEQKVNQDAIHIIQSAITTIDKSNAV